MNEYKDDPRLTAGQNELARKLAAEGNASGEYTEAEKLAMVASELMDPKEVGLTTAEEAKKELGIVDEAPKLKLGTGLRFECWIVPPEIRAEWAYQDTKIILAPADKATFIEYWLQEHRDNFLIQARLHCGNGQLEFEQGFNNEVLGLCEMMKQAGDKLEKLYLSQPSDAPEVFRTDEAEGEAVLDSNEQTEQKQPVE